MVIIKHPNDNFMIMSKITLTTIKLHKVLVL